MNTSGTSLPSLIGIIGPWLVLVILWSFFWKGLALWHSAQRRQVVWFVIFVVLNTAGILEIIYLFGVIKLKFSTLFSNHRV